MTERTAHSENLERLHERTEEVVAELSEACERYQRAWSSRQSRAVKNAAASATTITSSAPLVDDTLTAAHGALAFSFSQAHQLVRVLRHVTAPERQPPALRDHGTTSSTTTQRRLTELRQQQVVLDHLLPRAALLLETHGKDTDGGGSAADAAAAMRSLVHTRSLLSMELQKVDSVVQGLAGSSESVSLLQQSLQDVSTTVEVAQEALKQLLVVKSKEDLVLRVSAVVFVLVIVYIVAQRAFGLFPVTRYVRM